MAGGGIPAPTAGTSPSALVPDGPIPPFPLAKAIILSITVVNESLCANMLLPFIGLFVAHLQGRSAEEAGFASGFLVAVFQLGQVIAGKRWGHLSDKYGRKPALQGGLVFSGLIMVLFGLSPNIYLSVVLRLLHGLANGNVLVAKAMIPEVMGHKAHEAKGYTIPSLTWCLGTLVGPAIGGALYDPTRYGWFPFGPDSLFGTHPALLPSLVIGGYSFFALAVCTLFLPETNANAQPIAWLPSFLSGGKAPAKRQAAELESAPNAVVDASSASRPAKTKFGYKQAFQIPLTRVILIVYMIISFSDIAFFEILPLWGVAGRSYGGLSMASETVGLVILINGLPGMCANLFFSTALNKVGGPVNLFRIACTIWILASIALPYAHEFEDTFTCLASLSVILTIRVMGAAWSFSTCFLLIGRAAPPGHLGSINGIGQSAGCMTRTVAPILVAPIFAWSIQQPRPFPFNYHLAFLVGWIPLLACYPLMKSIANEPAVHGLPPLHSSTAAAGTIDIPPEGNDASDATAMEDGDDYADGVMSSVLTNSLPQMQYEDLVRLIHKDEVPQHEHQMSAAAVPAITSSSSTGGGGALGMPPLGSSNTSFGQNATSSLSQRITEATRQQQARSRANSAVGTPQPQVVLGQLSSDSGRGTTPVHGPLGVSGPRRFVVVGSSPGISPQLVLMDDTEKPSELSI